MRQAPRTKDRGEPPLLEVYNRLYRAWGPQGWWPGRSRLEVIVGAILTQNTAWSNVEKAIRRLRRAGALQLQVLHEADLDQLADWIRPAGYYNLKARRLRAFTGVVTDAYGGDVSRLFREDTAPLRRALLGVKGIGPETADSILLYAARRPAFVVDGYTHRFMRRHAWLQGGESYDKVAALFRGLLPMDVRMYNEYHALIVKLGKERCRAKPMCRGCPLQDLLPEGGPKDA